MKAFFIVILSLSISVLAAQAQSASFTHAGIYLKEAKVIRAKGDVAEVLAKDNQRVQIPFKDLPQALQASAHRLQAKAAAVEKHWPTPDPNPLRTAHVVQVTNEGFLVDTGVMLLFLKDHPRAGKVAIGDSVKFRGTPGALYKYVNPQGSETTARIIQVTGVE